MESFTQKYVGFKSLNMIHEADNIQKVMKGVRWLVPKPLNSHQEKAWLWDNIPKIIYCWLYDFSLVLICYSQFHGIFQARILEWVAISFSRRSSWSRDWTQVSCIASGHLLSEPPGKPIPLKVTVKSEHSVSITNLFLDTCFPSCSKDILRSHHTCKIKGF